MPRPLLATSALAAWSNLSAVECFFPPLALLLCALLGAELIHSGHYASAAATAELGMRASALSLLPVQAGDESRTARDVVDKLELILRAKRRRGKRKRTLMGTAAAAVVAAVHVAPPLLLRAYWAATATAAAAADRDSGGVGGSGSGGGGSNRNRSWGGWGYLTPAESVAAAASCLSQLLLVFGVCRSAASVLDAFEEQVRTSLAMFPSDTYSRLTPYSCHSHFSTCCGSWRARSSSPPSRETRGSSRRWRRSGRRTELRRAARRWCRRVSRRASRISAWWRRKRGLWRGAEGVLAAALKAAMAA